MQSEKKKLLDIDLRPRPKLTEDAGILIEPPLVHRYTGYLLWPCAMNGQKINLEGKSVEFIPGDPSNAVPLRNAVVYLFRMDAGEVSEISCTKTDENGHFRFENVAIVSPDRGAHEQAIWLRIEKTPEHRCQAWWPITIEIISDSQQFSNMCT